ncbi:MAG: DNA polymerase III subunit [Oscillospiraceae bacterium]|nr:DNA polymerase III subunit [Oscillospiraceae bacterium]
MDFDALLGNDALKQRLSVSLSRGQLSHCYLLSGPSGSGKHTLAKLLAAAMQCTSVRRPCGQCAQCRKALSGMHPDVITVDDPEKKTVPVKLVRDACADLYIRPNEGAKKVYLFPRAQDLNAQGQNALLKCIEEPPAYGVFLLLTEHAEQLLPTIRSRCVELRLSPLRDELLHKELSARFPDAQPDALRSAMLRSGGYLGQAVDLLNEGSELLPQTKAFSEAYCAGSAGALLRVLAPMERLKREQLRPILLQWAELLSSAAASRSGPPPIGAECSKITQSHTDAQLLRAVEAVQHAISLTDANVGTAHICGMLCVKLSEN